MPSEPTSWRCVTRSASVTYRSERSMPPSLMRGSIWPQYPRSIGSWQRLVRHGRGDAKLPTEARVKPELLATGPGQVWSWDISKLKGPTKGNYYQLYVILDIYSRSIVGWRIEDHESAELARELMGEAITNEGVDPNQLTIHADNGASMASHSVAEFLANLGVQKSHSRPHTSNDNPFSEAQFKTLKYRGDFPERFGSLKEARSFFERFFTWYQYEHHHAGLGLMTPADVHEGYAEVITERRAEVLRDAYEAHPERFVRKIPTPPTLNNEVWINRPTPGGDERESLGGRKLTFWILN